MSSTFFHCFQTQVIFFFEKKNHSFFSSRCSVKKRKLASSSTNTSVADIDEKITEISDDSGLNGKKTATFLTLSF